MRTHFIHLTSHTPHIQNGNQPTSFIEKQQKHDPSEQWRASIDEILGPELNQTEILLAIDVRHRMFRLVRRHFEKEGM
jgi:hypothetical protein